MKYFSMFSGIGGFELGIERAWQTYSNTGSDKPDNNGNEYEQKRARPTCVGFSEIDKYAIDIYQKHFGGHKNYGSATDINPRNLPDFDLLVGGFPCQAFSIAGKRRGFEEARGTLFFEIARIARKKQPRLLLLENVKGLLSHEQGRTFATILSTLDDIGYDAEWQVLNSKDFGVPQNREWVFIVGHLRGSGCGGVFPVAGTDSNVIPEHRKTTAIPATVDKEKAADSCSLYNFHKVDANCLTARDSKGISRSFNVVIEKKAIPVISPDCPNKKQNGRTFKEDGEPSFTLIARERHGVFDGCRIRRLTPVECERLQGFPDNWTAEGVTGKISNTQRYKCLGNAVTVNVIEAIMKSLIKCLND